MRVCLVGWLVVCVCVFAFLFVRSFVCWFVCLCVCGGVSLCLVVSLFICFFVVLCCCFFLCVFVCLVSVCSFVCLFGCLSVCLSVSKAMPASGGPDLVEHRLGWYMWVCTTSGDLLACVSPEKSQSPVCIVQLHHKTRAIPKMRTPLRVFGSVLAVQREEQYQQCRSMWQCVEVSRVLQSPAGHLKQISLW